MTSYHGGKQRLGKRLANVIHKESIRRMHKPIKGYCEPFCGMLGVFQHIPSLFMDEEMTYIASDTNKSVIKMWNAAQEGWIPPTIVTEEEYNDVKNSDDSALKGYVGHQYSFGGQYFEGYAPKYGKTIDSSKASKRVTSIASTLKDVNMIHSSYEIWSKLEGYVIYCDPPYSKVSKRYFNMTNNIKNRKVFDDEKFWEWCRHMAEKNILFVSGYTAPTDFTEIFSSKHKITGGSVDDRTRTEKLFVLSYETDVLATNKHGHKRHNRTSKTCH